MASSSSNAIYSRARDNILSQAQKWGAPAVIQVDTHGSYNPATDSWGTQLSISFNTFVLTIQAKEEDFRNISEGEKVYLVPSVGLPDLTQLAGQSYHISVGGKKWFPVSVLTASPGTQIIAYKILVKS